ncbi:MAG: aldehyde ferredoxin oxidoreductase C-terminal domain-containing protein, partial [Bacteroidetes bacterium]|nr:aldehyde ferredoxin oxidoreductase C-terminal domain-containing protein [Bacteroidota bacterium]
FAMECYEKKFIDDWNGLKLTWGNADAELEFLKKMAYRKGVGDIFADGTKVAAQKIGQGSEKFAINIYGMEISGINPKGALTFGVAMAVADFASHTRLWIAEQEMGDDFKIEDIPATVVEGIDTINVRNSLVICDFVPLNLDNLAEILNTVTGFKHTGDTLLHTGTRIAHLARRYNLRNGRTHTDDTLPARFFNEPSLAGFIRGKPVDKASFEDLVRKIYKLRGWNEKGEPNSETLKEYDIIPA